MKRTLLGTALIFAFSMSLACAASKDVTEGFESALKPDKKSYTGWVDTGTKELNVKDGIVQINVRPGMGTFNFSVLNDNNKYIPVLSTANEYTSSGFYLKAGKKRYRLLADQKVKTSVSKIPSGLRLNYNVAKVADVSADFEYLKSHEDNDTDMIKITLTVTNKGIKSDDFALRALLDTILGERYDHHFYLADNSPVKSEVLIRSVEDDTRWIFSRNSNASMQIILGGADISPFETVALANYSTLEKTSWEPDMIVYRAFDTVLAYKNSAVGINWPSVRLAPEKSASVTFYIALAADGALPQGSVFLYGKEPAPAPAPLPAASAEPAAAAEPAVPAPVPAAKAEPYDEFSVRREVPNVKFNVNNLSKEQLTLEYVQNLIDRISALEENSSSVNRKEILQLNAELDAILSVLRQ